MIKSLIFITTFWALASCTHSDKQTKQADKTLEFEKICFHTSSCDGTCPVYHLEVTKDRKMRLFAEKVYKTTAASFSDFDSTKMGFFVGTVTDSNFNKLTRELQNIDIDNFTFEKADCCDGSITTIIIYYNGKRKYISSMFLPPKSGKLISLLNDICEKSKLTRVSEVFDIESQEASR